MAAKQPSPSTSRRTRDPTHQEMVVGKYRRLEEIGRGSFATVYKATSSLTPGYVAIKSVDLHKLNKKLKDNLYSEIHILQNLKHPHIVSLKDCQETTAHIHLVMEFCELGDLSYFIKKRDTLSRHDTTRDMIRKYPNPAAGGLNEVIVRHFLKQLASALDFLREGNFIHRDVKPQNLLLDPSPLFYAKAKPGAVAEDKLQAPAAGIESLPTLKIADFGFARSLPSTSLAETLCGSPLYMAPEILRYEKYDAKADLWSVGTVLYEMMVGKPPFRASNHVELLRKIERGEDRIKFPEEVALSDSMKKLIRGLLKRNPVERISFGEFFNNTVIKDEIPGLAEEDRPAQLPRQEPEIVGKGKEKASGGTMGEGSAPRTSKVDVTGNLSQPPRRTASDSPQTAALRAEPAIHRKSSGTPPRTATGDLREKRNSTEAARANPPSSEATSQATRPSMISHATAPARQDLLAHDTKAAAATVNQRQPSRISVAPISPRSEERDQQRKAALEAKLARDRAAHDVAFERDYVVVEKRAVEVNAFADELAASPRIHGTTQTQHDSNRGAMIRRATTQGAPSSVTGAQVTPSRAMQLASGKRPDHHRQNSYERRLQNIPSATSAISKAIEMASGRLFSMGFSPPLGIGRGGPSPPSYNPFPAYPTSQGVPLMIVDGSRSPAPLDEDSKAVHVIEESATRSDVVYGFAEVKYKQLIPLEPSMDRGLGLRRAGIPGGSEGENSTSEDDSLTVDAIVTLSEEALVLYVKALSLLARSMDIAGAWWARKNRGEIVDESTSPRTHAITANAVAIGNRVNNVVQWVRDRFNQVLVKAEFVRLKLIEAQKQLPTDHPSHPSNHPSASGSANMGTSADNVIVTSGVTAETLMYDRALEMSKSAAVNELVGDDLWGCEMNYITAIMLLEAVLEDNEEPSSKRSTTDKDAKGSSEEEEVVNGVEADDRKVVLKLVQGIRSRLAALRKKMQMIAKRNSVPSATPPRSESPVVAATATTPAIATTPPQ
ncbi:MAG: Serine/threonine-protein kinase [Alectoria fallacina]|uniref:non-specific serine/threonine protein kinase n=1 Tax=Alectoria fallacina TaxID=1903189 RepID=A0A8H3FAD8_9LECA|nr:MAG: Serine/threonine-protein kinase [Alectoria fallacina]